MRAKIGILAACMFAAAARAGSTTQPAVSSAFRQTVAWQLSLGHAGFSPGMIDGKPGPKTTYATEQFQLANQLPATGKLDSATEQLLSLPGAAIFIRYTITAADARQVTGEFPDWNARAAAPFLGYFSLLDLVAEKFHTNRQCLSELNPDVNLDQLQVGDTLFVPDVGATPTHYARADSIEVDLGRKTIRLFNSEQKVIALFFCSIAASKTKLPTTDAKVITIAIHPDYTFDPALWTTVKNVDHKLIIPPGPRNPVGLAWVGLSLPGYGMHGTAWPELIGKTGSHGCFRLTNWDALHLANMVHVGLPVRFTK